MKTKEENMKIVARVINGYIGGDHRRTQKELVKECRDFGYDGDTRMIRKLFVELIENEKMVILGSHKNGYCIGNTDDEVKYCVNRLRRKAAKEFIRARRIRVAWRLEKMRRLNMRQEVLEGVRG